MRPDVSADDKDGDDEGEEKDEDDGFRNDFDDFEAGGEADDEFGDFDVGVDKPSQETQRPPPAPDIPFVSTLVPSSYLFLHLYTPHWHAGYSFDSPWAVI